MKNVNWGLVSMGLSFLPSVFIVIGFMVGSGILVPLLVVLCLLTMAVNLIMLFIILNTDEIKGKSWAHVSLGLVPSPFIVFVAANFFLNNS